MEELETITTGQMLEKGASQVPDKIAPVDGKQRKTYRELNAMADAPAARLAEIGFQKGVRAAICIKNSLELVVAFYALQKQGVIAVWVNFTYRRTESEFMLEVKNPGPQDQVFNDRRKFLVAEQELEF